MGNGQRLRTGNEIGNKNYSAAIKRTRLKDMIINHDNRKQLINFLIRRWKLIVGFAAVERVYVASCRFAQNNDLPIPQTPPMMIPQACRQIEIIKHRIIEILPEVNFIDYIYEAPAPLDPEDFVEVFIADHHQCIDKIETVIKKMQLT